MAGKRGRDGAGARPAAKPAKVVPKKSASAPAQVPASESKLEPKMEPMPGLVLVGRFGAPHGVRGEIRIKSYTAEPLALAGYRGLSDASGTRVFELKRVRLVKDDMLVAQVEGIGDRDSAETITNVEIFVARTALPPPDEDEFYFSDLIGLLAILPDGSGFGTVRAVDNFGAGDILVIETSHGDEVLLPFTKEIAPHVDLASGKITVVPPAEVEGDAEPGKKTAADD